MLLLKYILYYKIAKCFILHLYISNIILNSLNHIPNIFVNSTRFYYTLINENGCYIAANNHFLQKFGIGKNELEGKSTLSIIHPDDREHFVNAVKWCFSNPSKPYLIDFRKQQTGAEHQSGRWEFSVVPHPEKDMLCLQCMGYDISNEMLSIKQASTYRQEVLVKDELFEYLLSNSIDIILLTDQSNLITYCSSNIKKVLGYEPQEIIGQNGFSFVHPDDLNLSVKAFEEEFKHPDKNHAVDIRFRKKDGSWLWTEAKGKNLFNNRLVKGMLINLNDISLRKQAEQDLAKSELRYKSFFQQLPLPLFVVGVDYKKLIDVNDHAIEKYGYSKKEFQELTFPDLLSDKITCDQLTAISVNGQVLKHQTKNGDSFFATIEKSAIEYADMSCILLVVTDVTEAKRMREENQLGYDVSAILIQPTTLVHNLSAAIKRIRKFAGWDLAELWIPNFDEVMIRKKVTDYDDMPNEKMKQFLAASQDISFTMNDFKNVPSYHTLKPHWIEDLEGGHAYQRKELAVASDFKSSLAVPIMNNGKVISFLIFHSFQQKPFNQTDANLLSVIGNLLGAEMEKRKNDLLMDRFFSISSDILTIAGLDGKYKKVNKAFEEFTGFTQDEAKHIHPLSYVHEDDKVIVLEKFNELSNGKPVPYFENRVITKKGEVKWVAWTATSLVKEGMVIASHRDITTQKKTAEEIKMSNERYELIKKAANEAIWDYDLINQTITRSKGYKVLFGYDIDQEHAGLRFWESKLHPGDRARVMHMFNDFFAQKEVPHWQCEYRFQRLDGSFAYVADQGYLIFDKANNPIRMVGSMQDITEQKEFAEKLKISNERYELVTKATNEAIWDLDLISNQLTWSNGYKILFGHDFDDAKKGFDFWEENIHKDEKDEVVKSFNSFLLQHDTPFWTHEYRFKRKDGSYASVLDKGYVIFDYENKPVRMVGAMQDISERKKLEQEFLMKERNRQNLIAQAAISAQEKERAEIGKELHDNVSQLLTTTKLYLEMLRQKLDDPVDLIDRGTKHINSVISEIRNLSRSLVPTSITDLGLIPSINDLIESIEALGSIDIHFYADPDVEHKMEESLKLTFYRILQEQLNNIVKHACASEVSINLFEENNLISLIVEDNGKGFDINTIKKGMGIENIKNRAALQNGTVDIISYPRKGCKIKIQIPLNT